MLQNYEFFGRFSSMLVQDVKSQSIVFIPLPPN
jgi:hypothetical protein